MSDANSCDGHVGESCGWTSTNEGQGYTCQTASSGTGCESGGTVCPGGGGGGGAGGSTSGSSSGGSSGGGSAAGSSSGGSSSGGNSSAGSGGALPAHVLTGYWQNFDNTAQVVSLAMVPAAYGLIAVAFANADPNSPGGVTFSIDSGLAGALGGYTAAQFTQDIQTLHSQNRKVIVSVGGQNGAISVSDATSAGNFASSVYAIMTQYGFDGVDIDLENGLTPTAMATGLQMLAAKAGPGLIITLAPQTIDMQSTGGDYFQLALAIKDILTIVNMQYYNSGAMLGADGHVYSQGGVDFLTALATIQLAGGLRPGPDRTRPAGVRQRRWRRVCGSFGRGCCARLPRQRHELRRLQAVRDVPDDSRRDDLVGQLGWIERKRLFERRVVPSRVLAVGRATRLAGRRPLRQVDLNHGS